MKQLLAQHNKHTNLPTSLQEISPEISQKLPIESNLPQSICTTQIKRNKLNTEADINTLDRDVNLTSPLYSHAKVYASQSLSTNSIFRSGETYTHVNNLILSNQTINFTFKSFVYFVYSLLSNTNYTETVCSDTFVYPNHQLELASILLYWYYVLLMGNLLLTLFMYCVSLFQHLVLLVHQFVEDNSIAIFCTMSLCLMVRTGKGGYVNDGVNIIGTHHAIIEIDNIQNIINININHGVVAQFYPGAFGQLVKDDAHKVNGSAKVIPVVKIALYNTVPQEKENVHNSQIAQAKVMRKCVKMKSATAAVINIIISAVDTVVVIHENGNETAHNENRIAYKTKRFSILSNINNTKIVCSITFVYLSHWLELTSILLYWHCVLSTGSLLLAALVYHNLVNIFAYFILSVAQFIEASFIDMSQMTQANIMRQCVGMVNENVNETRNNMGAVTDPKKIGQQNKNKTYTAYEQSHNIWDKSQYPQSIDVSHYSQSIGGVTPSLMQPEVVIHALKMMNQTYINEEVVQQMSHNNNIGHHYRIKLRKIFGSNVYSLLLIVNMILLFMGGVFLYLTVETVQCGDIAGTLAPLFDEDHDQILNINSMRIYVTGTMGCVLHLQSGHIWYLIQTVIRQLSHLLVPIILLFGIGVLYLLTFIALFHFTVLLYKTFCGEQHHGNASQLQQQKMYRSQSHDAKSLQMNPTIHKGYKLNKHPNMMRNINMKLNLNNLTRQRERHMKKDKLQKQQQRRYNNIKNNVNSNSTLNMDIGSGFDKFDNNDVPDDSDASDNG